MGMKKTELGERLKEAAKAAECAVADLKKLAIDALEKVFESGTKKEAVESK